MTGAEPSSTDTSSAAAGQLEVSGPVGPRDRGPRRTAAVVLVALIAFVALAIVKPWAGGGPGRTPEPSSSSRTGAPRSPEPTVVPTPVARLVIADFSTPVPPAASAIWTGLTWREVAPTDSIQIVSTTRRWHGGFVAVGWDNAETPMWTSQDGAAWQLLPINTSETFWPGLTILGVAEVPTGLVALLEPTSELTCAVSCQSTSQVSAWTSGDGGSWTPHASPSVQVQPGRPTLLAAGPAGLVAATSGSSPQVATSADGVAWLLQDEVAFPSGFELHALTGSPAGYVAGGDISTSSGRSDPAILWSADGLAWSEALPVPPTARAGVVLADTGSSSEVDSFVAGRDGLIAVGRVAATPGAVLWWQSSDGQTWQPLPTYAPVGPTNCQGEGCGTEPNGSLAADGLRVVAARGGSDAGAWTSFDAQHWQRLEVTGEVPSAQANLAVLLPGGVLTTDGSQTWFGVAVVSP